jgi:hypothetical protein
VTVLTSFDDYPIHSSSSPVAFTSSGDPNHYDRYFFNGYRRDASLYFGVAMGLYPNRHVADASFSVVLAGKRQVSLHSSMRAPVDRASANSVGPIEVRVVEPMRRHRVLVDSPEHGIRAELEFVARSGPVQEPHFHVRNGVRTIMDYTRLTQFGHWTGWIEVEGRRHEVTSGSFGSRDRSWGIRPIGPVSDAGAPFASGQFFWLWAPVNFDSYATHFDVNEFADGRRWHEVGFVIPDGDAQAVPSSGVEFDVEWRSGTRWARRFSLHLHQPDGNTKTLEFEPMYEFQMKGIGYFNPDWGHGHWKGELAVGAESWDLPVEAPCRPDHLHIQAMCKVRCGSDEGLGILEQLAIGPHEPTGLSGAFDPAR